MGDYDKLSFFQLHDKITAEHQHIGRLEGAAVMWDEGAQWIGDTLARFKGEVEKLAAAWPDKAGDAFAVQAQGDMNVLRSWVRGEGEQVALPAQQISTSPGEGWKYTEQGIVASKVAEKLRALAQQLQFVFASVDGFFRDYHASFDGVRAAEAGDDRKNAEEHYRQESLKLIVPLATAYGAVKDLLPGAAGRGWSGAQSEVVPELRSDRQPGDGTPVANGGDPGATGGDPGSPGPAEAPQENPAETPESPAEQKPLTLKEQLELASQGLDVAGKVVDLGDKLADQFLGSGTPGSVDLPDPATVPNAWEGWKPGDLPSLSGLPGAGDPSGLPGLAGLSDGGGGIGGGLGAGGIGSGGGVPSAPGAVSPLPGIAGAGTGLPGTTAGTGAAGGTTGSMGGSPGMMPMYPHNGAGGRAGGGDIRPGAAEQVNAVRSRKPEGNPGVALRGRAGAAPRPPVTRSRPAVENDVVHVLDEELWQVDPVIDRPHHRTGY
ncbi:hypothetical protein GCM10027598_48570 [Amycolatopsis oliviviridis]|uniref:PPE family domain-containing protein n=1 Tax=Amycolatopsis oliviviridis TaxID=1471590 RepID=A0ABQ3M214_9PSEU|nr:hypothetical protein [Amycolatopsis oliviviridis]GHH30879.1 hypothetical protein GCM10017790_65060 [Amycolatopsis oliviviridis]